MKKWGAIENLQKQPIFYWNRVKRQFATSKNMIFDKPFRVVTFQAAYHDKDPVSQTAGREPLPQMALANDTIRLGDTHFLQICFSL